MQGNCIIMNSMREEFITGLIKKEKEAEDVYSFYFKRPNFFNFLPGQYIKLSLDIKDPDERGVSRYFTIASSPTEHGFIMITTRIIQSSFKKTLVNLSAADKVKMRGPFGDFILYEKTNSPQIFLAGGIGITPARSIAVFLKDKKLNIKMTILASFSAVQDIVYFELLKQIESDFPQFKFVVTVTKPEGSKVKWNGEVGRIDEQKLKKYIEDINAATYYISGPRLMVEAMEGIVKNLGINPLQVKTEVFPGY